MNFVPFCFQLTAIQNRSMPKEIERKFLVTALPFDRNVHPFVRIEQGYLALEPKGQEVRLRKKDDAYFLTVKSQGNLTRQEYETTLDIQQFEALWPATRGRRLQKNRFLLAGGVEVDIYEGNLQGLIVAEIEFQNEESAKAFQAPAWVGQEVTHINFLKNRHLLQFENWEAVQQELAQLALL